MESTYKNYKSSKRTGADGRTIDTSNIGKSRSKPKESKSTKPKPKDSGSPQVRSTPSRQRRKRFQRDAEDGSSKPQWDDDFDDVTPKDNTQSQKEVVERYATAAATIAKKGNANALADFADHQHKFSDEERAEVKKTLQSSIDALQRIADRIH